MTNLNTSIEFLVGETTSPSLVLMCCCSRVFFRNSSNYRRS